MTDEPTNGELARIIDQVRRSIDALSSKVLTVEVWKAEKESMDFRLREVEKDQSALEAKQAKDVAALEARMAAEKEKREREKIDADSRAASHRRNIMIAVLTSVIAPIVVGLVLAWVLKG